MPPEPSRPAEDLCAALCERAPPRLCAAVAADPVAAEAQLGAVVAAARAAWPGVEISDEVFVRHLGERAPAEGEDLSRVLGQLQVGELYLACGCLLGVPVALRIFEEQILSQVPAFLAGRRLPPEQVDEVRQQVRVRLLVGADGAPPKVGEYGGRGTLSGWVRVVTVRLALNLHRKMDDRLAALGDADDEGAMPARISPELDLLRARCGQAFKAAFAEALAALPTEARLLLRLHLLGGLNTERIGALLQVSRATAGRRLAAAREAVAAETRGILARRLHLSTAEIDSLQRMVMSQVDVSLARCLREATAGEEAP